MSPNRPAPQRLERTFGFIDLCGFTDFSEDHGDDEAAEVLHLLRTSVREAASDHGVLVDKWLGDGAMLVAGEPSPLLAAVIEVKGALADQAPLAVRAGVASGAVMVFEGDDYVGRAINLASKLCDLAEPGECVAPVSLAAACPVGLSARPAGSRTVPGFAEPVELVAIDAIDAGDDEERARTSARGTNAPS